MHKVIFTHEKTEAQRAKYPIQQLMGFEPHSLSAMPAAGLEGSLGDDEPLLLLGGKAAQLSGARLRRDGTSRRWAVGKGCHILRVPPKHGEPVLTAHGAEA